MNLLLWWALYAVLVCVPFWFLLPKYGMPKHFAVLAVFPILAVGLLWFMAFRDKIKLPGDTA